MDPNNIKMDKKLLIVGVIALLAIFGGYWYGNKVGYAKGDSDGHKRAEADIKKIEEDAGKKATAEAAKAANPFQVSNPLENVDVNPFQKAKKVLNPF